MGMKESMKGIRFKIKSKNGNKAIKKLKEILPALELSVPLTIPITYISKRSYNEKLLNPGGFMIYRYMPCN